MPIFSSQFDELIATIPINGKTVSMEFWIFAVLLVLLVMLAVLLPQLLRHDVDVSTLHYDRELYKARISEIKRDTKLGRISEDDRESAIAEEGRKLIALSSATEKNETIFSRRVSAMVIVAALIFVPGFTFLAYDYLGKYGVRDLPLQARLDQDPRGQSMALLLQRAENQLARDPKDGKGWAVVAPVYMRLGRTADAINAYRNAIKSTGSSPELMTSLGEALAVSAGGIVTEEAHKLFTEAAQQDTGNAKPQFFLAIALNQSGEYEKASKAWRGIIAKSPAKSPWLRVARQQLELAVSKLGNDGPGDPTSQDVAAASQMSANDRSEMINNMVAGLAQELEEDPKNKPGWQRIIRSYIVLGRKSDASAAIEKAKTAFADDSEFLQELSKNETQVIKMIEKNGSSQ